MDAEQYTPKAAEHTEAEHEHDTTRLTARTDKAGRVAFTLPRPGVWIITTTHMIEAPADSEADWESIWGALTVEVPSE